MVTKFLSVSQAKTREEDNYVPSSSDTLVVCHAIANNIMHIYDVKIDLRSYGGDKSNFNLTYNKKSRLNVPRYKSK